MDILLSFLVGQGEYDSIISFSNALPKSICMWSPETAILVEHSSRLKMTFETPNKITSSDDSSHAVTVTRPPVLGVKYLPRQQEGSLMKYFKCDKPANFSRAYVRSDREVKSQEQQRSIKK